MNGQQGAGGSNPVVPVKVSEIPERFFQVQDKLGFFWQAFGNGALVSGETQYLQSGLNLIIDGDPFKPSEAFAREPASGAERIDLSFFEKRPEGTVARDLWFDTDRAAVRVLDTFSNTSGSVKTFAISLRTTYPFSWQSLHGSGGALLSSDPGLRLDSNDFSLGVHFSPSEGRHDTFFILGSEKSALKPELKASPNSRELTFSYSVDIPPGESRSLVHWIMQRNLSDVSGGLATISPFIQRGRLIVPGIDPAIFSKVVNFDQSAFQTESPGASQLKELVALNRLMDRFGYHRRGEDLLWVSPANQVSGAVGREGVLTVSTPIPGDRELKISEIAAIKGGVGNRRNSLIYLRDGTVLAGKVTKGEISWSVAGSAGSTAVQGELLDPNSLHLLLLATSPSDGVPPPKASHFLQLTNGSVIPLKSGSEVSLRFSSALGSREVPLSEILELAHTLAPYPHHRIILKGGSSFSAFLSIDSIPLESTSGEKFEVMPSVVDRIWPVGSTKLLADSFAEPWLDFSEIPPGIGPPGGFLLSGNALIDGVFADESLLLSDNGEMVTVDTARIQALRRIDEPESEHLLEIELIGGDKIVGELSGSELKISSQEGELSVPAKEVLSYRVGRAES